MSSEFETTVISRLDDISTRLSSIEEKINDATSFADSVLGEDGVMPSDGMEALKSTFSSLLNPESFNPEAFSPQAFSGETSNQDSPESIGDLVAGLKTFQERLASVRDAVSELPKEDGPPSDDEE
jgi:hypothetical protein